MSFALARAWVDDLVYSISQFLTNLELHLLLSGNGDGFASLGVAPRTSVTLRHGEGAETYESHRIIALEGIGNTVNYSIQGIFCLTFGEAGTFRDFLDQISLIHLVDFKNEIIWWANLRLAF